MKHEAKIGSGRSALAVKSALSGIALSALLGLSMNAQAQTCTTDNWDSVTNGPLAVGTQGPDNRRYGGPCGLRIDLDGSARYLIDESPTGESSYIVRFYGYLDDSGTEDLILYEADDGTAPQIQVWKNVPEDGDLTLNVFDQSGGNEFLTVDAADVGSGWKAIEFAWEASTAADNVAFSVSDRFGEVEVVETVDTSGITIANALLGNVNGATGGSVDFDDYDSRRVSRPGRLLQGDADDNGEVNLSDVIAVADETFNSIFPAGQPDCDENGEVNLSDVICVADLVF
jgi:hypothetical protein